MSLRLAKYIFWSVVLSLYFASVYFSYQRVYVNHDYPIFYSEDDMPDPLEPIKNILNLIKTK